MSLSYNDALKKLIDYGRYDVTLTPQGQGDNGIAVSAKVELLELTEEKKLQTYRKVSGLYFGKDFTIAQKNAIKECVKLLGL